MLTDRCVEHLNFIFIFRRPDRISEVIWEAAWAGDTYLGLEPDDFQSSAGED
jgi:hypothetical protein